MAKHGAILSTADVNVGSQQITATPGATVTLDVTTGHTAVWTAGENETVNATGAQFAGQRLTCLITNDALLPRTITFGTGFRPSATVVGVASKVSIIEFVSSGSAFVEGFRTVGIT